VEDGGETEGDGDGEAERAHTALDDEVGAEFREKKCGNGWVGRNFGGRGSVQGK
jgi:hypothetical protein